MKNKDSWEEELNSYIEQYKLVVLLQYQESNRYLARYNVFLTLNSGFAAIFFLLVPRIFESQSSSIFLLLICFLGICFTFVWFFQSTSGRAWETYWIIKARNIEKKVKIKYPIYDFLDKGRDKISEKWYENISIAKHSLIIPISFGFFWIYLLLWLSYYVITS